MDMDPWFEALAAPSRRRMLDRLHADGEQTPGDPAPLHEIHERSIGGFERTPLQALHELKQRLEDRDDG
jgi:hypothetical protein